MAQTEQGVAQTEQGVARTEQGVARTEQGVARTEQGVARNEGSDEFSCTSGLQIHIGMIVGVFIYRSVKIQDFPSLV